MRVLWAACQSGHVRPPADEAKIPRHHHAAVASGPLFAGRVPMTRRELISLLGGAAAWPFAARAAAGCSYGRVPAARFTGRDGHFAAAFLKGLKETGYVEGENLAVEYRWAEGRYERPPQFAADLASVECAWSPRVARPRHWPPGRRRRQFPIVFIGERTGGTVARAARLKRRCASGRLSCCR